MRVKRTLLIAAVGCGCLGFALQTAQKKYVMRDDQARLQITADGVEHLEENYRSNLQRRRLQAPAEVG